MSCYDARSQQRKVSPVTRQRDRAKNSHLTTVCERAVRWTTSINRHVGEWPPKFDKLLSLARLHAIDEQAAGGRATINLRARTTRINKSRKFICSWTETSGQSRAFEAARARDYVDSLMRRHFLLCIERPIWGTDGNLCSLYAASGDSSSHSCIKNCWLEDSLERSAVFFANKSPSPEFSDRARNFNLSLAIWLAISRVS